MSGGGFVRRCGPARRAGLRRYRCTMHQRQRPDDRERPARLGTCCTIDDLYDARRVAATIGIPHYIVNFESQLSEHGSRTVREHGAGPDADPARIATAISSSPSCSTGRAYDAEQLATSHYARIAREDDAATTCIVALTTEGSDLTCFR